MNNEINVDIVMTCMECSKHLACKYCNGTKKHYIHVDYLKTKMAEYLKGLDHIKLNLKDFNKQISLRLLNTPFTADCTRLGSRTGIEELIISFKKLPNVQFKISISNKELGLSF